MAFCAWVAAITRPGHIAHVCSVLQYNNKSATNTKEFIVLVWTKRSFTAALVLGATSYDQHDRRGGRFLWFSFSLCCSCFGVPYFGGRSWVPPPGVET